jgi:hypothetical protein
MTKKQKEERVDIMERNWIDEFENDFCFASGAVDLVIGNFMHNDVNVRNDSIVTVLYEAQKRLDRVGALVNQIHQSQIQKKVKAL